MPGTTGKKPGFAEARLFRLWSMFRIDRPKAGILRAARPRSNHTHQEPPANVPAAPETINAAVVPAAKKARLRARQRVAGHDREEAGLCRSPASSVMEHVQNRQAKSRDSPSCQTRSNHTHQEPPANVRAMPETINAAVYAAKKARLRTWQRVAGHDREEAGLCRSPAFSVWSMFRIDRPKAGILRAVDPVDDTHPRTACERPTAAPETINAAVVPAAKKARFRGGSVLPGTTGKKPGFAEARLFRLWSMFRIDRPKAGILRAARPRSNHTHQEPPANVRPQRQKPSTPRWYPLRKKPGFARGSVLPGTTGKKPGFAEARLFRLWSMFRIDRPKAGILRAVRPRSNHTHQEPPANVPPLRQKPSTPRWYPLRKKPGFARWQRVAGHDREEAGLCRSPAFSVIEHVQNRQAKTLLGKEPPARSLLIRGVCG